MEVIVVVVVLVVNVDGECLVKELEKLDKIILVNDNLMYFGFEIGKIIDKYVVMYEVGVCLVKMKLMKEISDVDSDEK